MASEKSEAYTFSTLISEIKKIIIHKNAKGISISKEMCLRAREKIEEAIINKQNRTKLTRGRKVKVSGFKKAIITLKKGQSIDLTTGI